MSKIGIIGAGTWGSALANTLVKNHDVFLYSVNKEEIEELNKTHIQKNLKDVILSDKIIYTFDLDKTIKDSDFIIMAVPSKFMRDTTKLIKGLVNDKQIIISVSKGIENDTLLTLTDVIEDELKNNNIKIVALSGPSHAEEVAINMPTTIVAASKDKDSAKKVQALFKDTCIRVYTNDDPLGVELCAAIKNVIALASGIASGLGYGDNTKAAIITRGMAEIKRLGIALGAKEETFAGLSGIGDLIVTATSNHSRNNRCGYLIGQGLSVQEAKEKVGMVVEGLNAIEPTLKLAKEYNIEMPITETLNDIVLGKTNAKEAVIKLMNRKFKDE